MSNAANDSDVPYCGDSLIIVGVIVGVLQVVAVAARFYTRHWKKLPLWVDDWLMLPALAMSLACTAIYIALVKIGALGYHFEYVAQTPEKLVALQKGLFASQIMNYPFTVTPAKISILLFYSRVFSVREFQIIAYIVGAIALGLGIGVFFAAIFQCQPIAYVWDPSIGGHCFNQQMFFRWVSLPNILTDAFILVMPLPFIWKLHTAAAQKVALTGVFQLGSLGIVFSILRMTTFFQSNTFNDPTWVSVLLGIWTILEPAVIIIAACLPPAWPLISHALPRRLLTNDSNKAKDQSSASHPKPKESDRFSVVADSDRFLIRREHSADTRQSGMDGHEGISLRSMQR